MASVLELYEKLKPTLGEEGARSLLEYVETSIEHRAVTKADLQEAVATWKAHLQEAVATSKADLQEAMATSKADLKEAMATLREEFHREIHQVREDMQTMKADLIKWSFAFWAGTVAVLSGIMFTLLRTVGPR
jgi:cell fate (sporulation/competence/biofilm development) regulator YmcA (YheA/YmcA/DUF963 family)